MRMDLKIDARKLTSITKLELKKQARFAAAKALTQAAFDSRSKLQRYLRRGSTGSGASRSHVHTPTRFSCNDSN